MKTAPPDEAPQTAPPAGAPPDGRPAPAPGRGRRVRTPTVLQMELVECGAAALGMVLGYYGRFVPLEELRVATGVSRDGAKASNVVRAARTYGLIAEGRRAEPEALPTLPVPMILHWNFDHFVVAEGFGRHEVYLNDPAQGPRTVSYQELDESFTGVVLTFAPGPDFRPGGRPPSTLRALAERLAGSWMGLVYCVLVGLLLVLPGLLVPIFGKVFVDDVLVAGQSDWVGPLLVGMALTALLRGVLTWMQQRYLLRLTTRLAVTMSGTFLWHVLHLPVGFFAQRFGGEIAWRVGLNDTVAQLLSGQLATSLLNLITVLFYSLLMLYFDARLALVVVAFAVLNLVALRYVARRRVDLNMRLLQEQGKLQAASVGGLQTIETIKADGAEASFFARWAGHQATVLNARQELGLPTQVLTTLPPLLQLLASAAVLIAGAEQVISGALTAGTLVAFQSLTVSFMQPFGDFVNLGGQVQEAQGQLGKLDDVLRAPADPALTPAAPPVPPAPSSSAAPPGAPGRLTGRLELRRVTFGYSPLAPPLIEDFSLSVAPGQRVALVGTSGSGKSTIANLVSGLYQPWSGEVLLDGRPRTAIPRDVLAASLAMVNQEIFLFEGTVAENLTLWNPAVSEAAMIRAAKDAGIHDAVVARPGGYSGPVEEGGRNFSGGEAQRLEIARALTGDPTLLVLDEATSALDPLVEQAVDTNLRRRGCTCLIVAHRLSTIRDCDEIIVLEQGKVVQRGTHEQMKDADGPYARLIAST